MAVLNSRTRTQIRRSIGYNLGAMEVGTTNEAGTKAQVFDTANIVFGTVNEMRSKWVVMSDSSDSNSGEIRRVLTSDPASSEINTVPFTNDVAASKEFELWDRDMPPARIHDFINRVIESVTRRGVVPDTDSSLHFGGGIRAFTLPTTMVALENVEFRVRVTSKQVLSLSEAITASDTNVTVTLDDEDYRQGSSNKITFAAAFGTGEVATDTFPSVDLGGMTHLEYWAKANDTTAAGDFVLFLNDTATEQISVPALSADAWTWQSATLSNPESDTAIATFGIEADVDPGTKTFWLDDVRAIRDGTQSWENIHSSFYDIDRANRQLVFKPEFKLPYAPIKLNGFRKPNLLTSDSASSEIDAEFIIARATAMALRARADRSADDRQAAHLEAERQDALAEIYRNRMQLPRQARWFD